MYKILCAFVGMFLAGTAMAADVVERTSCSDVKARMDELAASADLSEDDAALLADLRATYRRDCSARAGARATRTIAAKRLPTTSAISASSSVNAASDVSDAAPVAESCSNPDSHGCCPGEDFVNMGDLGLYCCTADACFPPMEVQVAQPEKTAEEIAEEQNANLANGLCKDGTKPNKFGCCAGEKFKDMGNLVFACCPDDGGDCYPPITQEVKK